jgi:hypothetical protein
MIRHEDKKGLISLTLFNPYCPRQEVSGATTDIDAEGIADYALAVKQPELIKWWGHSHVNMDVSPSGTDMTTFHEHVENDYENPFIMTIHNKSHKTYCNIYLGHGMYAEDVSLHIDWDNPKMVKQVKKELKANVREKKYVAPKPSPANGYYTGNKIGNNNSQRGGSGGNRLQLSSTALAVRNAARNLVGFGFGS